MSGQVTWATGFVGRRLDITNRLIQHYPQAQFLMLTPAWVDYSRWLGIGADSPSEPTSLSDQIEISAALTKAFAARKGTQKILFSGFASFDPARCLTLGKNEPDPIEVIDKALGAGKIIGVKLYPPIGFSIMFDGSGDSGQSRSQANRDRPTSGSLASKASIACLFSSVSPDEIISKVRRRAMTRAASPLRSSTYGAGIMVLVRLK